MRASLLRPYVKEEGLPALQGMHFGKSLGPDGLPALFYTKFWDVVGEEVCSMMVHFLNFGGMPDQLNDTNVVSIPKVKSPPERDERFASN